VRVKAMHHMVADVLAKTKPARGKGKDSGQEAEDEAVEGDDDGTTGTAAAPEGKKGAGRFFGR
jgi:hypothetical protein